MREIKFMGKSTSGAFVIGNLVRSLDGVYITSDITEFMKVKVDEKTIGEYTGLNDKNGIEIYEGDIIETEFGENKIKSIVTFKKYSFWLENINEGDAFLPFGLLCVRKLKWKKIGNIHQKGE